MKSKSIIDSRIMGILTVLALFVMPAGGAVRTAGFSSGAEWTMMRRQGTVMYYCQTSFALDFVRRNCARQVVFPSSEDYFVHTPLSAGNRVTLNVQHEDGLHSQMRGWNKLNGSTIENFKLIDDSFSYRSLLHEGVNQVNYQIQQDLRVIEKGTFSVKVFARPDQQCSPMNLGTPSIPDYSRCLHDVRICNDYLEGLADCR